MLHELNGKVDASLRLQEISTLLIQEGNLDALYERVLDAAVYLMRADVGSMQKYDPERNELRLLASRGFPAEAIAFWDRVNRDSGTSCGMALSVGHRVVVPDVECADFMAGSADLEVARQVGLRAMHSTPLISRSGWLLGMISTHWQKPHSPAEHELRALDVLARQAADLIERVQVETTLRQSEQRLRWIGSVVESSDDAIISKNLDGIITSWNRGAELLFSYTAEEAIGQPVTIIIPQDRLDEEREILARIGRGERINHFETVRQRKHGGLVSISLTVSPVKNAEGRIVGASKVARDITEQKLAWKTAEMADRAKSSFLAAASHDLRQPLQTLKLLQAALELHHPSGEARNLVTEIGRSLDTMTSILSSLLDVNRLESGNLRPFVSEFSLSEIFESLAGDFAAPVLERGLQLCIVRSELIIRSDRHMLAQMIRNLLSNAVRYTDRGRILLGCRRAGDNVRIEVWDSGVGITEGQLPHIFQEYYQGTDGAERGGFGLGLAIVKRLGDILDHRVEVRSIRGEGTRFFIEVPRGRSSVEGPETAPPLHPHNDAFRGSVLAIEDEASVRLALGRLLKVRGVDATIVATATEALTLVSEQGLRPDVLLSDYNLRGSQDGMETIKHLRVALGRNVPAVVITGDIRSETVDSISSQGVSVLIKPFSADELLEALRGEEKRASSAHSPQPAS
jgi:PAS domain S-box-containing protein